MPTGMGRGPPFLYTPDNRCAILAHIMSAKQIKAKQYSPYLTFERDTWKQFAANALLTLTEDELAKLRGQNEPVSLQEVADFYLPLSRLLNLYVNASQDLHQVTGRFLNNPVPKVPYIIGIAGSVAVGKSTTSRILRALLSRWPNHNHVEIVTTDGFLYPSDVLEERDLMSRKGFPESFNTRELIQFLSDLKAGKPNLKIPIYSHRVYDILPNKFKTINQPDIIIVEGLNVLQNSINPNDSASTVFVSDFFDFSIYVDAKTDDIKAWFLQRFMSFRERDRHSPELFFHRFRDMTDKEALAYALDIWHNINEANLNENILPFRERAKCILKKAADHSVERVLLRKL